MLDKIFVLRLCTQTALSAAALSGISGDRRAFDVPGVCHGYSDVLVGDQVLDAQLYAGVDNDRPTLVGELPPDLCQFIDDDLPQNMLVLQNVLELSDVLDD